MKMKRTFPLGLLKCVVMILIFVYLCLQMYLFMKRKAEQRETILSYESALCGNSTAGLMPYARRKCPKRGITTFMEGILPNHMWQYANVLATSLELGLEGYVPICLKKSLQEVFTNVSVPILADISHCDITLREVTDPVEERKSLEGVAAIRANVMNKEMVLKHLDVIRRHFVVKKRLADLAGIILLGCQPQKATYVGVYISERNNAIELTNPEQFILAAMDKFRKEYKDSYFVVVARDRGVWDKVFQEGKDVCVLDQDLWTRPSFAMALLSRCSHNIIMEWEFGPWASILSGGDAIVSFSLNEILNPLMKFHDNWKYLISETQFV